MGKTHQARIRLKKIISPGQSGQSGISGKLRKIINIMRTFTKIITAAALTLLVACKPQERLVTQTITEYKDRIVATHDTTIMRDSVFMAVKGDTIYKEKYLTKYLARYVHDTATVMRRDSVPYAVEIPAKLTKAQQYYIDNYTLHVVILLSLLIMSATYISYLRRKIRRKTP